MNCFLCQKRPVDKTFQFLPVCTGCAGALFQLKDGLTAGQFPIEIEWPYGEEENEDEDDQPNFDQDRLEVAKWAAGLLSQPHKYCILDTETTGLENRDQVIEIAALGLEGEMLFNQRVRPTVPIHEDAFKVHNISYRLLANERPFSDYWPALQKAIGQRQIIVYNRKFDAARIYESAASYSPALRDEVYQWFKPRWAECAMEMYAQFHGDWSDYHQSYKWQRLPGGDHSALGDCYAVLRLLKLMAAVVDDKWEPIIQDEPEPESIPF